VVVKAEKNLVLTLLLNLKLELKRLTPIEQTKENKKREL
jgi:hypothetical protein